VGIIESQYQGLKLLLLFILKTIVKIGEISCEVFGHVFEKVPWGDFVFACTCFDDYLRFFRSGI